jgi:hypothetical protein
MLRQVASQLRHVLNRYNYAVDVCQSSVKTASDLAQTRGAHRWTKVDGAKGKACPTKGSGIWMREAGTVEFEFLFVSTKY